MPYITTRDGTRLYTKIWGTGRTVVLMHGWPLSPDSWDDQSFALASAGFRVVAYDRRGFGRSDQPWTGYEYDTLADDLADVLKETDSKDAAIVGFSMGGGEVARYMSRHGGKGVRQAGLISSIVPYMLKTQDNPDGVDASVFEGMRRQMIADRASFFSEFFNDFYGVGLLTSPVSPQLIDWSRSVAMQAGLKGTLACADAFATTDFRSELQAFEVPTLIVHGTADKTVPIKPSALQAANGIRHSKLTEIDGGPHGLLATHKHEISEALIGFLKQ